MDLAWGVQQHASDCIGEKEAGSMESRLIVVIVMGAVGGAVLSFDQSLGNIA